MSQVCCPGPSGIVQYSEGDSIIDLQLGFNFQASPTPVSCFEVAKRLADSGDMEVCFIVVDGSVDAQTSLCSTGRHHSHICEVQCMAFIGQADVAPQSACWPNGWHAVAKESRLGCMVLSDGDYHTALKPH